MYKKVILLCCTVLFLSMCAAGCSKDKQGQNEALTREVASLKEKYEVLDSQVKSLEEEVSGLNKKLQEEVTAVSAANDSKNDILPLYRQNIDSSKREVGLYISIPKDKPLKEKLELVADKLSEHYFSDLPIDIVNIESMNNKKIAVVNLKESKENQGINDRTKFKGKTWATGYFQGSTGGSETSVCLIETFLQKDYAGEWIDGVRFTYDGESCSEFDHIPDMAETSFRK